MNTATAETMGNPSSTGVSIKTTVENLAVADGYLHYRVYEGVSSEGERWITLWELDKHTDNPNRELIYLKTWTRIVDEDGTVHNGGGYDNDDDLCLTGYKSHSPRSGDNDKRVGKCSFYYGYEADVYDEEMYIYTSGHELPSSSNTVTSGATYWERKVKYYDDNGDSSEWDNTRIAVWGYQRDLKNEDQYLRLDYEVETCRWWFGWTDCSITYGAYRYVYYMGDDDLGNP